ncbi:hypothetical protein AAFF_G00375510 [Aldrovandia affinis]|uniref:Uncharacterized protein n=1 Tax=Aldrovandia affinis TaxID=143900 RepID=A0AAD7WMB7_9TELE|nr:hypothetical protein AAFF_G00375510 [Aldrovandia affinis]
MPLLPRGTSPHSRPDQGWEDAVSAADRQFEDLLVSRRSWRRGAAAKDRDPLLGFGKRSVAQSCAACDPLGLLLLLLLSSCSSSSQTLQRERPREQDFHGSLSVFRPPLARLGQTRPVAPEVTLRGRRPDPGKQELPFFPYRRARRGIESLHSVSREQSVSHLF